MQADSCKNMEDIRKEIDQIDKEIIALLGKRYEYVRAASKFKKDQTAGLHLEYDPLVTAKCDLVPFPPVI